MDGLTLDCSLSTNGLKGSKISTTVSNLIMEGAKLHHGTLVENTVDSPSVTVVDDIKLAWVPEVRSIDDNRLITNKSITNVFTITGTDDKLEKIRFTNSTVRNAIER